MIRGSLAGPLVLGLILAGCPENSAPGNDREAELAIPEPAAEVSTAGPAIEGVATRLLTPQAMTDADLGNIPAVGVSCLFRFTAAGLPVLAYGRTAVLKLNGRLVPLPPAGEGEYVADGVTVTVRPLDEEADAGESFAAEFVLQLPDAIHELGYHGFSTCESPVTG